MKKNMILLLLLISPLLFSQEFTRKQEVDSYLKNQFDTHTIPGLSVVIADRSGVLYTAALGTEIQGEERPMTIDSPVAIGSLTKSFTAMAVLLLAEQGKLDIHKPVITYLPWFRTLNKEKSDRITIKMLLSNTSGLPALNTWIDSSYREKDAVTKGLKTLSTAEMKREPGKSYEYSNDGWNLLGALIEEVSGMAYEEFIQKEILTPLKMTRSTTDIFNADKFYAPGELTGGHHFGKEEAIAIPVKDSAEALPAGSFFRSTARDMGNYLITLLNNGSFEGNTILSRESLELMWTPVINFPGLSVAMGGTGNPDAYCLGWMKSTIDDREIIHHGGNTGAMSSFTLIDRKRGTAVSLLSNIGFQLDPYRFPTITVLANNILHTALGEPISTYGIPITEDPNLNFKTAAPQNPGEYRGTYLSSGSNRITLHSEKQRVLMEAIFNQTLYRGELKFINNDQAIFHTISETRMVNFLRGEKGHIKAVNFSGNKYYLRQAMPGLSQREYSDICSFPLQEKYTLENNQVILAESAGIFFSLTHEKTPEELLTETFPHSEIQKKGHYSEKPYNTGSWKEQSFLIKRDGRDMMAVIIMQENRGKLFAALLYAPMNELSGFTAEIIPNLIRGFEWK